MTQTRGSRQDARVRAFEEKRMEILRKVAIVFAEDGYHQTSVNSLAKRLNVSKPVLYYYAKNKDDLLFQSGEIARDELTKVMESTANNAEIDGLEKIRRFFAKYAEIMCGPFGRCLVLVDRNALSESTARQDVYHRRKIERAVQAMITEGQADGSIGPCDPAMTARVLFGAFNGIPVWFKRSGNLDARNVASSYLDLFIRGIGPR